MLYAILGSLWFWIPFGWLFLIAVLSLREFKIHGTRSEPYSLKMIRESISTGITVVGIFILGLATLVIWLREHYGQGVSTEIVPVFVAIFFFSGALIVALYLLYYSATEFEDENKMIAKNKKNHLFMIWYGLAAHLVLVGVFVLFSYFGFIFRIDKLHFVQLEQTGPNYKHDQVNIGADSSASRNKDSLVLFPQIRKGK
ncbi:MAG TPA: hypothetical protein VMF88_10725 [Bacteroidota bacterium]|nr:hypothetical protein [Bacteroidota bacterium]